MTNESHTFASGTDEKCRDSTLPLMAYLEGMLECRHQSCARTTQLASTMCTVGLLERKFSTSPLYGAAHRVCGTARALGVSLIW